MPFGGVLDRGAPVAFFAALLLAPLVAALARRIGFVDEPRADRAHQVPTPYLGGLAVFLALAAGLVLSGQLAPLHGRVTLDRAPPAALLFFVAGAAFLLGFVDDWRRLSPPAKMAGQVVISSAFLAVAPPGPFRSAGPDGIVGFFWIVGLMNACNFLDNMDGVLAGAALPATVSLSLLAAGSGRPELAAWSMTLAGALAGFLAWNRPKARIFLGDAGSLLIGGALAALGWMVGAGGFGPGPAGGAGGVAAAGNAAAAQAAAASASDPTLWLALPLALAYPIFDMAFVTITRLRRRQPPWVGGRDHTTHRLATLTGSGAVAFLLVIVISAGCGAAALAAAGWGGGGTTLAAAGLLFATALLFGALGLRLARVEVK